MEQFGDRVNAIKVQVTSPDNNIRARLHGEGEVDVQFRPKAYPQYSEQALEHQIARTATLIYTGYYKAYDQLMVEFNRNLKRGPEDARDEAERGYLSERAELQVVGATQQKLVRLKATGLYHWECRIAPGTIDKLSEAEFTQELQGAIQNFLARYQTKMSMLFAKHYGGDDLAKLEKLVQQQQSKKGSFNRAAGR